MKVFVFLLITVAAVFAEEDCVPGKTFMMDCNWCTCNSDGIMGCTLRACPPGPERLGPAQKCIPDSRFMVDCNWCKCSSDGSGMSCTRKQCLRKNIAAGSNQGWRPN